jgi:hypothetical protein
VLEGLVDLEALWGSAPETLFVAFAAYASPDGGTLAVQAPCGDGDGELEAAERTAVTVPAVVAVTLPAAPAGAPRIALLANPAHGEFEARVDAAAVGALHVALYDVRGRSVATLFEGEAAGPLALRGGRGLPAGLYFLVARSGAGSASARVVLLSSQ